MAHLEDRSPDELRAALATVDEKPAALRLVAAIAYADGVSQTTLADWFGVERKTIYNWLGRLDDGPLHEAAADRDRPGRPRRLSGTELDEFRATVREPPERAGYDESVWSPALARRHLREAYGVEYSVPSCRRLLKEASLR